VIFDERQIARVGEVIQMLDLSEVLVRCAIVAATRAGGGASSTDGPRLAERG